MANINEMKKMIKNEEYKKAKFWNTKVEELNNMSINELNKRGNEEKKLEVLEYYNDLRFNIFSSSEREFKFTNLNSVEYVISLITLASECRNIVFISNNILRKTDTSMIENNNKDYYKFEVNHDYRKYTGFISKRKKVDDKFPSTYSEEQCLKIEKIVKEKERTSNYPLDELDKTICTSEMEDNSYFTVNNVSKY